MRFQKYTGISLCGLAAGAVNGLFGAGGGMILVPLLTKLTDIGEDEIFPTSISIILPVCLVSLGISAAHHPLPWLDALPYLIGSAIGGVLAGMFGRKLPVVWLHRILGALIVMGGIRYLC